jgi:hypothetical protein
MRLSRDICVFIVKYNVVFASANISRFHSVMVIISVFESGDPSSILGETYFAFLLFMSESEKVPFDNAVSFQVVICL